MSVSLSNGDTLDWGCDHCHGGFILREAGHGRMVAVPCSCQQDRATRLAQRRLLEDSRLPPLQQRHTFQTWEVGGDAQRAKALTLARAFAQWPEGWLYLWGGYGSGKTGLAAAIVGARLSLGELAVFWVVQELLKEIKRCWDGGRLRESELLDAVLKAPLLILDDLGQEYRKRVQSNEPPWALSEVWNIINYRYNHLLPLVITSNGPPSQIAHPSLRSRIKQSSLCTEIHVPGGESA